MVNISTKKQITIKQKSALFDLLNKWILKLLQNYIIFYCIKYKPTLPQNY